jgi:hypothetical protein
VATSANLDSQTGILTIDLLRPGEALVVIAEVASETYRPDLQIQMKSSEMSTVIRAYRSSYPVAIAAMTVILLVIAIFGILVSTSTLVVGPTKDDVNRDAWSLILFFSSTVLFPLVVGSIIYWLARKIISRATTPVAWRFSERKVMALNIRQQFTAFKKFMSIVNKQS